jgi:hypothetical protein
MALRTTSDILEVSVEAWDQKTIQAASLDVMLTFTLQTIDAAGETDTVTGNWIETADATVNTSL